MKKIKTIFSPRKFALWIFIGLLIYTIPIINEPAMSKTDTIVTTLCVDKIEDKIEVAMVALSPGLSKTASYQVFTGEGKTMADAVDRVSALLGKNIGFAQCEIIAFGENIINDGVMVAMDYLTRTKKIGGNAVLISFEGETNDFAQAILQLNSEKAIRFDDIINHDKHYAYSEDSNVDSFYKGYYEMGNISIMPLVRLESVEDYNAVEVAAGTNEEQIVVQDNNEKKYLTNDGTAIIFKKGKKVIEIDVDMVKKINLFLNGAQQSIIEVKNIDDELYNGVTANFKISKKKSKIKTKFENGKPIVNINLELTVLIEEVVENEPNNNYITRNKKFLTDSAVQSLKDTVEQTLNEVVEYIRDKEIDIFRVYKNFNAKQNKQFKSYIEETKEKYLDGITFNVSTKISSAY